MKTMRSYLFPLIIIFLNCCIVHSQQAVSSMGANLQTTSGSISFTLGEPVIATLSITGGIITQGFHQTRLTVTAIDEPYGNSMSVKVYPNPTADILFVSLEFDDLTHIRLVLYDLTGVILSISNADKELIEFDFSTCLPGVYFLKVYKYNREIGTYKIVKQK